MAEIAPPCTPLSGPFRAGEITTVRTATTESHPAGDYFVSSFNFQKLAVFQFIPAACAGFSDGVMVNKVAGKGARRAIVKWQKH